MYPKLGEIKLLIFNKQLDIFGLNETRLDCTISNNELQITGYCLIRNDRSRRGGGVAIYIRDSISHNICLDLNNTELEVIWCKINPKHKASFLLCCAYRAPSSSVSQSMNSFMLSVDQAFSKNLDIIIMGDININCDQQNYEGNAICNLCNLYNMKQLVEEPTRVTLNTKTLIDVILTSMPEKHKHTTVFHTTLSDHFMVCTEILYHSRQEFKEIKCRTFKNFNASEFIDDVSLFLSSMNYEDSLETLWHIFKEGFKDISNKHAPLRSYRVKANSQPWISQDIVNLMKERDKLYKEAISTDNDNLYSVYRKTRNYVTQRIRNEKKKYFESQILSNNDNQQLWRSVKIILGDSKTSSVPVDVTSDEFNTYFSNIGTEINKSFTDNTTYWRGPESIYNFIFKNVSEGEIYEYLLKLPDKSNNDILGFDSKLLRIAASVIRKPSAFMINISFNTGVVLSDWKKARICPIYKGKGSKTEKSNYRPISFLGHITKIFEKCAHGQLLSYLEQHDFISVDQSAFIKHHSTQTLLLKVVDNWLENIENGLITGICYFDVAKCFDSISHDILLFKMGKYGIRNTEINWFKSYLNGRLQATYCHNILSNVSPICAGIPQGSILGPLLFVLFMSDLSMGIFEIFKYADDTMIDCFAETMDPLNSEIQMNIDNVDTWFKQNKLRLNINKTSLMYIGTRQRLDTCVEVTSDPLKMDDQIITINDNYTYLGLTVDGTLSWNKHVDMLCNKLKPRLGVLYRLSQILPRHCLVNIYFALIQSVIDYGLTLWGHTSNSNINKVQKFQNRAARICTQCFDYTISSSELLLDLGWLNNVKRRDFLTCILILKCMSGEAPNYLCDLFMDLSYIHNVNIRSATERNLYVPFAHSSYYKNALRVYGPNIWNKLPNEIKTAQNISQFKYLLKCHLMSQV